MAYSGARWRGSFPTRITVRWPLTMTLHCWSSASRWSSPTPSNPSAYPLTPTSSLRACPAGSQAGALSEKEVLCRNWWFCVELWSFFFFFFIFLICCCFSLSLIIIPALNNFAVIPQLTMTHSPIVLFLFAYPAHIKIKTSHSSPILLTISYSSPYFIFFSLPASFFSPSSLSFHPVFSLSFNVPPISLSLPSWHTSLLLNPPSLFSHLFLICSIPLSLLPYPYIKADIGSPGKPLKPSLANTNPAH